MSSTLAPAWRLLVDPPADGAWNMAVDEVLLESVVSSRRSPATLRLYGWQPAALSLGRSQPAAGAHDPRFLRGEGIDLVRRPTGGGAVLHEHELTYAVTAALRGESFPGGVLDTYARIAAALAGALRAIGVDARAAGPERRRPPRPSGPVCFEALAAHEISAGGMKLVGSAQLRRRGAFLQHGSIPIRSDRERVARAFGLERPPAHYTDLATVLGRIPPRAGLDRAILRSFEATFGARLEPAELSGPEREAATRLRARKYLSAVWTHEGREPPAR